MAMDVGERRKDNPKRRWMDSKKHSIDGEWNIGPRGAKLGCLEATSPKHRSHIKVWEIMMTEKNKEYGLHSIAVSYWPILGCQLFIRTVMSSFSFVKSLAFKYIRILIFDFQFLPFHFKLSRSRGDILGSFPPLCLVTRLPCLTLNGSLVSLPMSTNNFNYAQCDQNYLPNVINILLLLFHHPSYNMRHHWISLFSVASTFPSITPLSILLSSNARTILRLYHNNYYRLQSPSSQLSILSAHPCRCFSVQLGNTKHFSPAPLF